MNTKNIKEKLKKIFLELIHINSLYPHEDEVIAYVENRFNKASVSFQRDSFGNIIVKIPGKGKPLLLSTHLDIPESTPKPKYKITKNCIQATGKTILGADPKTGLAILIEFLCQLAGQKSANHRPLEIVLTRGEEAGLFGARGCDYSLLKAREGLVLDEDGPVTQVVIQAPCYVRFDASFVGKIVHPREPEKGINALQACCHSLISIPWGYCTEGVTWNVGLLESGTARNSVPGNVSLKAELRSFNTSLAVSEAERIEKEFQKIAKTIGASCVIDKELEFEGYRLETKEPLFKQLEKTFKAMRLKPNYFATFGGSDASIFNARGIRSVPIGSGYYNAHQYTELANLKDMVQIFEFLNQFVKT